MYGDHKRSGGFSLTFAVIRIQQPSTALNDLVCDYCDVAQAVRKSQ